MLIVYTNYNTGMDPLIDPLPFLLWLILAGLLVRIGHSSELAPEFSLMVLVAFIRCTLWLSGHIGSQNWLAYFYPFCQLLAAEESIRLSGYVNGIKSGRYLLSLGVGLFVASVAWYQFPGGIITWRACSQIGIFTALVTSALFSWRYRLSVPVLKISKHRHYLLILLMLGSILSSRPGGENYTVWTEIIHIAIFLTFYRKFPRRSRASINASIRSCSLSAAS